MHLTRQNRDDIDVYFPKTIITKNCNSLGLKLTHYCHKNGTLLLLNVYTPYRIRMDSYKLRSVLALQS